MDVSETSPSGEPRMTEFGVLPTGWELVALGDLFEETSVRVSDLKPETSMHILSVTRHQGLILQTEKFGKRVASADISRYKVLRRGEMVYGFPMDEGVIYFLTNYELAAVSPVYFTWRKTTEGADSAFLDIALKTPQIIQVYKRFTSRSVHRRRIVSSKDFRTIKIPVPPLTEQRAIAAVLSTIQRAIDAQDKVIAAAREVKKSLMRHLFTYGPVPVAETARVPLKETQIGLVPENWEVVKLDEVLQSRLGKMLSAASRKGVSPRPYLRNANVQWGRVDLTDLAEMDFDEQERDTFRLKDGDVLTCEGGEVGRTAIWRDEIPECYFQKAIHRLRPTSGRMHNEFIMYHMMNAFLLCGTYGVVGTTTTIAHLPGIKLKALKVPLPPYSEQQEIADILRKADKRVEAEEKRKAALQTLFKTALHLLMTGQVRVG